MARISRKKFNLRLYILGIVLTAMAATLIAVIALLASGLRYQTYPTSEHGDVKFFGKVKDGVPVSGTVYYEDGVRAQIVSGKAAEGNHKLTTWVLELKYTNGDTYEGESVYFLRHGKGTIEYSGGDIYQGEFVFDQMEGKGKYTYLSGDVYEGQFADNKKNGKGKYTWAPLSDGKFDTYEGEYADDKRDGEGTYVWADGTRYIGEYASDAKNGKGAMYFPDGAYYEGDFKNDTRTGKGKYKWASGDTYEGDFHKGTITGIGTYTWTENEERKDYTGYFENGKIVIVNEDASDIPVETLPIPADPA